MDDQIASSGELVPRSEYDLQLREFEKGLLNFLADSGLPSKGILVPVKERIKVFSNIDHVLEGVDADRKKRSIYISKFLAATSSGLFDAALNYLWDETISELRFRVCQYDLSYFYDNAIKNPDKRKRLSSEEDITKIDDSELIHGAKEIGIISDLGFRHLDNIRYMRNYASAAHPNQNQISGLVLVGWLETCFREVISLPLSDVAIEIKRLLANVKSNAMSDQDAKGIVIFFSDLSQDQVNTLASGFFGIYTRLYTSAQIRQNIKLLLPSLWPRVDESTRKQFGIKYAKFFANNDQKEVGLAKQFLDIVSAESYIPDQLRIAEIETAIENLLNAHRNWNNFSNEPVFARVLQRLIGEEGNVPTQIREPYVIALVEVFLSNGNGVAHNAEPIYLSLINLWDAEQALMAVLSFVNPVISSRLQFSLCQKQYRELLTKVQKKVSFDLARELIRDIENFQGPLSDIAKDVRIIRTVANLNKIIS